MKEINGIIEIVNANGSFSHFSVEKKINYNIKIPFIPVCSECGRNLEPQRTEQKNQWEEYLPNSDMKIFIKPCFDCISKKISDYQYMKNIEDQNMEKMKRFMILENLSMLVIE